jgi:serine/threonine-protein kinase
VRFIDDRALAHLQRVSDEPDLTGTRYRLLGELGRGGMGAVHLVLDEELGREVALKVARATGPAGGAGDPGDPATAELAELAELAGRLRQEARIIAGLEHPGIVPVHDVGLLPDGRVYYVMKRVRGERLDRWAARKPGQGALLRLFQRICETVAFAHAHGVIHRDLKPENVMVGEFGEALVLDWGIARPASAADGGGEAGQAVGTPAYMAPEQARGEAQAIDARTDVYGLGAVLYFLLAARAPFDGPSARAVIDRVAGEAPSPLRGVQPAVPRRLESICAKAMARDPADRYGSADLLAADIGRFLDGEPVAAHRESALETVSRLASRHAVLLSLLGTYLLVRVLLALLT